MLQWSFSIVLVSAAAFAFLVATMPAPSPTQPILFSHKAHIDYFQDGRHRQAMISMHNEILDGYKDGQHASAMVEMHRELLMKELDDKEIVSQMIKEQIAPGYCSQCHRDYDTNARNLAKLVACAECHRRKDSGGAQFAATMMLDVERNRCVLCHGDFDRNAGEHLSRLAACAACHRSSSHVTWEGRKEVRPCMGCHNAVFDSPHASLPNTKTCAACHVPPLGNHPEETKLAQFIAQERTISWAPVYDYLPGEIVFSHERHVLLGQVRCQQCHGDVERATQPLAFEMELRMEDCMDCHEATAANNDCMACHR